MDIVPPWRFREGRGSADHPDSAISAVVRRIVLFDTVLHRERPLPPDRV